MNALRYAAAAAAAASGLVLGHPVPAHDGQGDYLNFLDSNNVSYSSVSGAVSLGEKTCHHLRGGGDFQNMMDVLTGPLGYTRADGAVLIAAAVSYLCPDAESVLRQQLGDQLKGSTKDKVV